MIAPHGRLFDELTCCGGANLSEWCGGDYFFALEKE